MKLKSASYWMGFVFPYAAMIFFSARFDTSTTYDFYSDTYNSTLTGYTVRFRTTVIRFHHTVSGLRYMDPAMPTAKLELGSISSSKARARFEYARGVIIIL